MIFITASSLWYKKQYDPSQELVVTKKEDDRGIKEKTKAYYIDVTYPIISSEDASTTNAYIRDVYLSRVSEFKKLAETNFAAIPSKDLQQGSSEYYNIYNVSFAKLAETSRYISFVSLSDMTIFNDKENSHKDIDVIVFDKKTKNLATLENMFIQKTPYLVTLAKLVQEEVKNKGLVVDQSSLEPTRDNFSKIVPTENGLIVYIKGSKNDVASLPYQQVTLSYTKLQDSINQEGVLSVGNK